MTGTREGVECAYFSVKSLRGGSVLGFAEARGALGIHDPRKVRRKPFFFFFLLLGIGI